MHWHMNIKLMSSCCFYEKSRKKEDSFTVYKLQVCSTSEFFRLHLPAVRIRKLTGSFEDIQACNCVGIYIYTSLSLIYVVIHKTV